MTFPNTLNSIASLILWPAAKLLSATILPTFCTSAGNHLTLATDTSGNPSCPTSLGIPMGPGDLATPKTALKATQNFSYSQSPAVHSQPAHTPNFFLTSTHPTPFGKNKNKNFASYISWKMIPLGRNFLNSYQTILQNLPAALPFLPS